MKNINYKAYLIHSILSLKAKEARDMMKKFENYETDEDLDKLIYYRGKLDAIEEILHDFMYR